MKYCLPMMNAKWVKVTPCVGVWIEITPPSTMYWLVIWSLPAWECGLKLNEERYMKGLEASLPAWECGLKYQQRRPSS